MSCSSNRIQLVQGDTAVFRIAITDPDDNPINPDDFDDILFTIKRSRGDSDSAAVFAGSEADGDIVVVSPSTDGLIDVTIPGDNTTPMRPNKPYYWDCKLVLGTGPNPEVFTVALGTAFAGGTILDSAS